MIQKSKNDSMLGFAIKSGKIIYGQEQIEDYRKKMHVIIVCQTLSENTKKSIIKFSQSRKIPLLISTRLLNKIVNKENCKVIALRDFNMARYILNNLDEYYQHITSEEN